MTTPGLPHTAFFLLTTVLSLQIHQLTTVQGQNFYMQWDDSDTRATFYGGSDAAGTMGGACGYGNLYNTGYGTLTAAASVALYNGGALCGACYEVQCISRYQPAKYCRVGSSVLVTVTNLCPQGSEGGGCDYPQHHLDMAFPAWARIGTDAVAGVLETRMRRMPCRRRGGVQFFLSGNPYWLQIMVSNVAGPGDIRKLEISSNRGKTWAEIPRNWGSIYAAGGAYLGKALSFRLTGGLFPQRLTTIDAVPSWWQLGNTYQAKGNFITMGKRKRRGRKAIEIASELAHDTLEGVGRWIYGNASFRYV